MVPWNKLPEDLQKAILTMIVVFGSTSVSCRLGPAICDPPPPPATTPMICDPPPPPSMTPGPTDTPTITATSTAPPTTTPMICDPPPPPSATPMICDPPPPPPLITVAPGQHFTTRAVQVVPDATLAGVTIRGTITDQYGQPLGGLTVTIERDGSQAQVVSGRTGGFFYSVPESGTDVLPAIFRLTVQGDETSALTLELKLHDAATIEWVETWEGSQSPLPLAEVRVVDIVWQDGLTFAVQTPWPGARYRWSVSGGTLVEAGEGAVWQPPAEPGRYLLQVVADWGRTGLAVDAVALAVEDDGSVTLG